MSMSTTNTHRREMRAVTPVGRIGRNAAGAAIAAGLLIGGSSAALAEGDQPAAAPLPQEAIAPVTAAVAIPAVAPTAQASTSVFGTGLEAADISVKPKPGTVDEETSSTSSNAASATSEDDSEPVASSAKGSSIVETARNGIGVRYVWGGTSRSGWDCSGFTSWVYAQHGISLPHSSSGQRSMGRIVSRSEARPGDIAYTPGHVGIYAGGNTIIDAGNSGKRTTERQMWSGASWSFIRIGG